MTTDPTYTRLLANLSRQGPVSLDEDLAPTSRTAPALSMDKAPVCPAATLWDRSQEATSYIGVRVTAPIRDAHAMAARLAAAAVERQVVPILLSHVGHCGLERFGFRVEHVSGPTADYRAASETQMARFWQLAIIVDWGDVANLG